jgi:hypothetical protein
MAKNFMNVTKECSILNKIVLESLKYGKNFTIVGTAIELFSRQLAKAIEKENPQMRKLHDSCCYLPNTKNEFNVVKN